MGRRKLVKYKDGAYHVNAKTNNSEWFPLPLLDCWNIFGFYLKKMSEKYQIKIHAFTLMGNHFHLLCSTPNENLSSAMNYFMTSTSKGINLAANKKNHLYGGSYFWTHASDCLGYAALYKYVLRNPVRAKICQSVKNYPYTSYPSNKFHFVIEKNELDELIPLENILDWLDECPEGFDEKIFGKILRKNNFEEPIDSSKRRIKIKKYI